ncbi:MAG: hypothetical protein AB7U46_16805 [Paenirhodobacter sp.]|uniref:hypothetical protein n=1 Tax=Paenirhodobacter sp. TaxID=1965326 RepID=UPI003D0BC6B4
MFFHFIRGFGLALMLLSALLQAAQAGERRGRATVGDYLVNWGTMPRPAGERADVLLFTFGWKTGSASTGVSEADWAFEARRQGTDVYTLKTIMGRDVYRPARGGVAVCTMSAVAQGLCGRKLGLSEAERAGIAASVLRADGRCTAAPFDPAFNRRMSNALGAVDQIVVLRATCR